MRSTFVIKYNFRMALPKNVQESLKLIHPLLISPPLRNIAVNGNVSVTRTKDPDLFKVACGGWQQRLLTTTREREVVAILY
jgi:hypothetical protein